MSLFAELKRRNVVRMALLYAVISWLLLQVADVLFDQLGVPPWAFRIVLGLLILGFPVALIFSWLFELTPEGVKREREVDHDQSIVHETGHKMNTAIVVLLVLAIGALVADRLIPRSQQIEPEGSSTGVAVEPAPLEEAMSPPPADPEEDERSIAVLPFINMSGDPDNEYFSDGLSEELLNSLVRLGGLKVTGRTSSFAFKGQNQDLREIGRLLSVAHVLEGSVRKAGNRVRITAQLVKTSDGYHLWSETFDRDLDDIFAIQAEIAERVANSLVAALRPGESTANPVAAGNQNAQAYEQYLRGMYVLGQNRDDEDGLEKAKQFFEAALAMDDVYPEPYWGLFNVWARIHRNGFVPYEQALAAMTYHAAKLDELVPGSEQSLLANARLALLSGDWNRSLELSEEAVRRYPGSASAIASLSSNALDERNFEKALESAERALSLDPLSMEILEMLAVRQYRMQDCDGIRRTFQRASELVSNPSRFHYLMAFCVREVEHNPQQALQLAEKEPLGFMYGTATAILYHQLGEAGKAQERLDAMMEEYGDSAAYQYAQVYTQWGQKEKALEWIETAARVRDPGLVNANIDGLLDPIRDEPRFQAVLDSTGFRLE